jgi:hypothetical protein
MWSCPSSVTQNQRAIHLTDSFKFDTGDFHEPG